MEKLRIRKDAWTIEADKSLTDIVLCHIRDGNTQLDAFEQASIILGRTAGACGFRWNSVLRKRHNTEIERAKAIYRNGKSRNHSPINNEFPLVETVTPHAAMRDIIRFLENRNGSYQQLVQKIRLLEKERELLLAHVAELASKEDIKPVPPEHTETDAEILARILERTWKFRGLNTEAE